MAGKPIKIFHLLIIIIFIALIDGCFLLPCGGATDCGGMPPFPPPSIYSYDPAQAGVIILEEHNISATSVITDQYTGFGKDGDSFYTLNFVLNANISNLNLNRYSVADFTFAGKTDLMPALNQIISALPTPLSNVSPDSSSMIVFNGMILFLVNFNDSNGNNGKKVVEYNAGTQILRFIDNLSGETIGNNSDQNTIWVYQSVKLILFEYSYDAINHLYSLVSKSSDGPYHANLMFLNNSGRWERNVNTDWVLHTYYSDILNKYSTLISTTPNYTINFGFLAYTGYRIIPDGNFLWAIVNGKITKMEPVVSP